MTRMDDGTYVTDLENDIDNLALIGSGYTIRHIETWIADAVSESFIIWDTPAMTEADIPF